MLLYACVPLTASMRVMARFGVWTGLMTAALAGWGIAGLLKAVERRCGSRTAVRGAVVAALMTAIMFESWSAIPLMPVGPRDVDRWLARQPGHLVVVELPVEQALRPFQDYYQTVHGRATVFGPVGDSFYPGAREARRKMLEQFPSPESLAALRSWAVSHVLLTPSQIPGWPAFSAAVSATPGLHLEETFGDVQVYRVADTPR